MSAELIPLQTWRKIVLVGNLITQFLQSHLGENGKNFWLNAISILAAWNANFLLSVNITTVNAKELYKPDLQGMGKQMGLILH